MEEGKIRFLSMHSDPHLSSVAAIVVTHRRPALATQVVRNLIEFEGLSGNQIYLVVNGEGGLDDPDLAASIHLVYLQNNIGPAGGFREGMLAAAADAPYEWFYLCEDDIGLFDLPERRLRRILSEMSTSVVLDISEPVGAIVAYGRDLHHLTGHTTVHRARSATGYDEVDAASWGATLVNRLVIDRGVLPVDDYFFGYEDFDYFYRIKRSGLALLLDNRSAVGVASQMSIQGRNEAFAGKRPLDPDEPWRAFYVARNYFHLSREHGSLTWILAHFYYSVRRFHLSASSAERRAITHGLFAGMLGATGRDDRFLRAHGELSASAIEKTRTANSSTKENLRERGRFVLHVLPNDIARGAQVMARDLCDLLNGERDRHEILTIFDSEPAVLGAEHRLPTKMGWRRRMGFDPLAYVRLRREVVRLRPDIIVAHGGEPLKYLALRNRHSSPLIYLAIGTVTAAAGRGLRRRTYGALMGRAEIVGCISDETRAEIRDLFGISTQRLTLLPNFRDPNIYYPVHQNGANQGSTKLVFVGHLTSTKRPQLCIDLVAELRDRGLDVTCDIVGDGPLAQELLGASTDLGITFLGSRNDVADILRSADIFVFTSIPESEGMPGVLIEAGMCGLPAVATDCPGVSTVIVRNETGYIVAVDDFAALVSATEALVRDVEKRQHMGLAAFQWCTSQFSIHSNAQRWLSILDQLAPI